MACRIDLAAFQGLCVHEQLRAVFGVAEDSEPFELDARIISVTEGGSQDNWVLGLGFIDNERLVANRIRLAEVVESSKPTGE